jgi:hypothetical protein
LIIWGDGRPSWPGSTQGNNRDMQQLDLFKRPRLAVVRSECGKVNATSSHLCYGGVERPGANQGYIGERTKITSIDGMMPQSAWSGTQSRRVAFTKGGEQFCDLDSGDDLIEITRNVQQKKPRNLADSTPHRSVLLRGNFDEQCQRMLHDRGGVESVWSTARFTADKR